MATTEEDLGQLEKDVRQLKIEYEQYFGGGRMRPPTEIEWRIELVIKRHADRSAEMNFAQRFRYSNLAQTYAKYREIFRKRLRNREEGRVPRHFGAAAKAIEAERARSRKGEQPSAARPARKGNFSMDCSHPAREAEKVEALYGALVEANQASGQTDGQMSLDSFRTFVQQKTERLKKEKGCQAVEYVVAVERGQVKLKARVK